MLRHRIPGSIVAVAAVLAFSSGCSSGSDTAISTTTIPLPEPTKIASDEEIEGEVTIVKIKDNKFEPQTVTIKAGDAVRWVFEDLEAHTATGLRDKGLIINSPVLRQGSEYQVVFNTPEELDYICAIHPEMTGKIIIEPK